MDENAVFVSQKIGEMFRKNRATYLLLVCLALSGCKAFFSPCPTRTTVAYAEVQKGLEIIPANDPTPRPRHIRFISPLLEYGYRPAVDEYENKTLALKPILLYLPGFDGTFLSPFLQFPELHTIFDVRCMVISTKDRSTFDEVCDTVVDYVTNHLITEIPVSISQNKRNTTYTVLNVFGKPSKVVPKSQNRSIYLAGESFGGIVALSVVERLQHNADPNPIVGLALINAATCYDRSRLAIEGPKVVEGKRFLYTVGLSKLLPLFTDQYSFGQLLLILQAKALPSVIDDESREAYLGRVAFSLPFVIPFLAHETLQWRLEKWLTTGCNHIGEADRLKAVEKMPTLIIAGETDATLPSIAEADRLSTLIPMSVVHVVDGAGHASTCGSRVDLAALFRSRFPELRSKTGRLQMKPVARSGQGADFGMEPRYDNATVGLNPIRYWTRKVFRACNAPSIDYFTSY